MPKLVVDNNSFFHSSSLKPGFLFGGLIDQIIPKELIQSHEISHFKEPEKNTDRYWMLQAFREALKGIGITNPNPAVGCVLVDRHGNEISRGHTQAYRGPHAEHMAIHNPAVTPDSLKEATAYVTLEPCSHSANQPPCVDLFVNSDIRKVVIARQDTDPRVNSQGLEKLKKAGKETHLGLYAPEVTAWNYPFFAYQSLKRPVIALKWAQTLDGQLADDWNTSQWISGAASRAYTHWLRQRYDTILVGAKTVLQDYPRLNVRDCSPPHQSEPLMILLDPHGLCLGADETHQNLLKQKTLREERPVVYVTYLSSLNKNPNSWLLKMKNILPLPLKSEKDIIPEMITSLQSQEVKNLLGHPLQSVLVEGGPRTLSSFLEAGYADILHVFIRSLITGGEKNRIQLFKRLKEAHDFQLISHARLGLDSVMEMIPSNLSKLFQ